MPTTNKKRGRQFDPNSTSGQIRELLKTGMGVSDIAKKLKCTPALVYNVKARESRGTPPAKRGPGRPPKSAAKTPSLDGIAGVLEMVKNSDRERAQLRAALEKVQAILESALS